MAVMSVLAGSIAGALAAKGASNSEIIINVLFALSVSTLFTGVLFAVGACGRGNGCALYPTQWSRVFLPRRACC